MLTRASTTQLSDNDIIPSEYQDKLIMWRDVFTKGSFEIGDIANDLCVLSAKNGLKVTQDRVFAAVGRFCGRSGRTVRYYAETAAFYSIDVRVEFDVLPFSHYVFARSLGAKWREVLEYAAEHPHFTEDALRMKFVGVMVFGENVVVEPNGEMKDSNAPSPSGENKSSETSYDYHPPRNLRLFSAIADLSSLIERFFLLLSGVKLTDEAHREINQAIETLRKYMPKVVEAVQNGAGDVE